MKILIIDDALDMRTYLRLLATKWGYEVKVCEEGSQALELLRHSDIRLVICDWMMPGLSGPELCRAIRDQDMGRYIYFILVTGRSHNEDLVYGLNAGADDFLSKPVDAQVLRARLRVGERILALEDRLAEQNHILLDSRNRLRAAFDRIQADLAAAARIQRQLLPTSDRAARPLRAAWLFLAAAEVSGDSFNFFEVDEDRLGFYLLDVSGHGIPSALLSTSLSRTLVPGAGCEERCSVSQSTYLDPAAFLAHLNQHLVDTDEERENFATIAYGTINKSTGQGLMAWLGIPDLYCCGMTGAWRVCSSADCRWGCFLISSFKVSLSVWRRATGSFSIPTASWIAKTRTGNTLAKTGFAWRLPPRATAPPPI